MSVCVLVARLRKSAQMGIFPSPSFGVTTTDTSTSKLHSPLCGDALIAHIAQLRFDGISPGTLSLVEMVPHRLVTLFSLVHHS